MINIKIETNYVRVIGNTTDPDNEAMNEMIGQEYEVGESNYGSKTIGIWNEDKSWFEFNKKDVLFLTAGVHKEKHIAVDDEVLANGKWRKVTGFYVYGSRVKIQTGILENAEIYDESEITDHRTGVATSLSGTQVTVTIDGKDYPATVN